MADLAALLDTLQRSESDAISGRWDVWKCLREAGPVTKIGSVYWVSQHEDVRTNLSRGDVLSADSFRRGTRSTEIRSAMNIEQRSAFDEIGEFHAVEVAQTDGAQHDRLRRIAQRSFTPRRIGELADSTERYVDETLTAFARHQTPDLMDFAYRVPLMIIGDLLGVPEGDRELIKNWSNVWFEFQAATDDRIFQARDAGRNFRDYVDGMIEQDRHNPSETALIASLIGAEHEERLTPHELCVMYFILLFAGHETTTNLIGTGLYELMRNREQWELLCADPSLIPNAVEELLRFVTPVQWMNRYVVSDIEIAGTHIAAGSTVAFATAAANRDSAVFPNPDVMDVRRPEASQHLALGFGPHFCLGASLARLETQLALRGLTSRFPNIDVLADDVEWRGAAQMPGLKELPVCITNEGPG